jgi:hypothetical protein
VKQSAEDGAVDELRFRRRAEEGNAKTIEALYNDKIEELLAMPPSFRIVRRKVDGLRV